MMKNRVWIIPTTVIILIIAAWALRWDYGGKQGDKTYYVDRWLGQTWVKDVTKNGYAEYPLTGDYYIEAQNAINADLALSNRLKEIEDDIKLQEDIIYRNGGNYLSKLNKNYKPDYSTMTAAYKKYAILYQEKKDIWNSVQASLIQNEVDRITSERKIASIGSILVASIALIFLLYFFLFDKKKTVVSEIEIKK